MHSVVVLRQVMGVVDALARGVARQHRLTVADLGLLLWIRELGGASASLLARRLLRSRQSVQRSLERMEKGGFAQRMAASFSDQTAGWVLTDRSRAAVEAFEAWCSRKDAALVRAQVDVDFLVKALSRLMEVVLDHHEAEGRAGLIKPPDEFRAADWDL